MDDLGTGWEHQRAGRLADAEVCYRRFLEGHPDHAECWASLGVVYLKQKEVDEAIRCFDRSLALKPGAAEVLTNLGVAYAIKGQFAAAERSLREAIAVSPPFLEAYRNLGHVLRDQGKLAEAIDAYRQARMLSPSDIDILSSLGSVLEKANRPAEAVEPLTEATKLAPGSVKLLQLLGFSLAAAKRFGEAEAPFRRALALDPFDVDSYVGLGNVLRDQDHYDEGLACYETAIKLRPNSVEAHNNVGVALGRIGKYEDSLRAYDRAMAFNPEHPVVRKNRGIMKLVLGDYWEGFAEYESRWLCGDFVRPNFTQPLWKGESIAGKTVLLIPEQGLGDTIQFIRFASKVKALGATVLFRCPNALLNLFADAPGIDALISGSEPLPPFDVYAPLISLAAIFRTELDDVPRIQPVPYLRADPRLVEHWRDRLGPRGPGELRVGIFWQGSPTHGNDRLRSVPLESFVPLAAIPGVKLISIQKGHGVEQIASLADRLPLLDFRESTRFEDTAALMSLLDLMITIDSAPVHLAGALGVPTWLALSTDAEWRWLAGREDSPWYPTVRVFRQPRLHNWDDVFQRMARALAELATGPVPGPIAGPISVAVAPGELIDKITILEIKFERISDPGKLANVRHELVLLTAARDQAVPRTTELAELTTELRRVNLALWDVEDALRVAERQQRFDAEFISLARSVYHHNDERAAIKRKINELLGSSIREEKWYSQLSG